MQTRRLEEATPVTAPDGCTVLPLVEVDTGSAIHCVLGPGKTSLAVRHTVIREIWYFIRGRGEIWSLDPASGEERIDDALPGLCVSIPDGASFQFRNLGDEALEFLCVPMPPWPGDHVATVVAGKWEPSV